MRPIITFTELTLLPTGRFRKGLPLFVVKEDVEVRLNGSYLCTIEGGFETDRTSWPRKLRRWFGWLPPVRRWLDNRGGRYDPSSVLHDHLLETSGRPEWEIDWLYHGALRCTGIPALEAWLFGNAVRARRGKVAPNPSP